MCYLEVVSHLDDFIYNKNLKLSEIGLLNYLNNLDHRIHLSDISNDDVEFIKDNLISLESSGLIFLSKVNDIIEIDLDLGQKDISNIAKDILYEESFKLNTPSVVKESIKNARKDAIISRFRKTIDSIFSSTEIRNKVYEFVVYLYYEQKQCFGGKELTNASLQNKLNKLLNIGESNNWRRVDMIKAIDLTMLNNWLSFNAFECNPNLINQSCNNQNTRTKKFVDITEDNEQIDNTCLNNLCFEDKILEIYKNVCFANDESIDDLEDHMVNQINEVNFFKQLIADKKYDDAKILYDKIENLVKTNFLRNN